MELYNDLVPVTLHRGGTGSVTGDGGIEEVLIASFFILSFLSHDKGSKIDPLHDSNGVLPP